MDFREFHTGEVRAQKEGYTRGRIRCYPRVTLRRPDRFGLARTRALGRAKRPERHASGRSYRAGPIGPGRAGGYRCFAGYYVPAKMG
jgi:hypothetical protein